MYCYIVQELDSLKNQKNQVVDGSGPSNANGPRVNESVLVERNEDDILVAICSSIDLDKLSCPTMSQANRWVDTLIEEANYLSEGTTLDSSVAVLKQTLHLLPLKHHQSDDGDDEDETTEDEDFDATQENKEKDSNDDVSLEDETDKGVDDSELEFDDEMNFNIKDERAQITRDTYYKDDDGTVVQNYFSKTYRTGQMWSRNRDRKISLDVGDMFFDKAQWVEVIREFVIQEGIALKKVKNDRFRHIVVCKNKDCNWRIYAAKLPDKVTWQIKSLKGKHKCPRLDFNSMATYSCIARHLYEDYVANPTISVASMNFARYYPGSKLHSFFFTAANAFNEFVHKKAMQKIHKVSDKAYCWLMEEPLEHWAKYKFDPVIKIPNNTTNYMESFNGKIERFINKPIMTLLEEIRNKWMSNLARRAELASK
ncbi:hypothetical protein Cgig2_027487 [Carnegiea gigantea]|uniref:Transposase MuDR plant domain-containing protein n=1 Tax=Carnegiea gigantea TaxID=171969 RepID=A0A9Q1KMW0_9CARY|nr:hypothetical protein Cgig2_027487 [Carnegiea gigantea]